MYLWAHVMIYSAMFVCMIHTYMINTYINLALACITSHRMLLNWGAGTGLVPASSDVHFYLIPEYYQLQAKRR